MKKAQNIPSTPVAKHFSPGTFFAATMHIHHHQNGLAGMAAATTPKRPPKLMEQRIDVMPKKGRRNSQQQEVHPQQFLKGNPQSAPANRQQPQQQRNYRQQGGMEATTRMETTATIFATPQRRSGAQQFRREHSASIVVPSRRTQSASFMRYTPPATFAREDGEVATVFAGSKFIESPSAKSLPLPPSNWLEGSRRLGEKIVEEAVAPEIPDEPMPECGAGPARCEAATNENFLPGTWSPPSSTAAAANSSVGGTKSPSGVRMHPLHLIAAAVMST